MVTIQLDPAREQQLRAIAVAAGRDLPDLVQEIVQDYLDWQDLEHDSSKAWAEASVALASEVMATQVCWRGESEQMREATAYRYKHLGPRPDSNYRQWFYTERKIRAETFYRATVGLEPRTPEEVAADYDVPVEAVLEAIHYCTHHEDVCRQDRDRELAGIKARGLDKPPYVPSDYVPDA